MATALVVLDMLNDFVTGTLANPATHSMITPAGEVIGQARRREDWIVIYGNDAHQPGDVEFAIFGEHALAGSLGAQVIDPLQPAPGDVTVPKRYYSAFTDTDLASTCQVHGIDRMVLLGQHTNCCCRHTAYDAFTRRIELAVVSDATCVYQPLFGDEHPRVHQDALEYLHTFYNAEILHSNQLF